MSNLYLRTIFGAAREHHVSNEMLHDLIGIQFGKTSLKDLTKIESLRLLDGIRGNQAKGRNDAQAKHGRKHHRAKLQHLVKAREIQMLKEAAALRGWDDDTLARFVQRQIGSTHIDTLSDFNKVFWPLKSMNRRDGLHK